MSEVWVIVLIGLVYILFFGGLSWIRREGLSLRFALEALLVTGIAALLVLAGFSVHPALFLLLLYLITMRGRVLVEIANTLARRGHFDMAQRLYRWALRLWPDKTTRHIIHINQATAYIQQGDVDKAIDLLQQALSAAEAGYVGLKYEAAAHYNLGIAYLRKDMYAHARLQLHAAIDVWPASPYARFAHIVLEKHMADSGEPVAGDAE